MHESKQEVTNVDFLVKNGRNLPTVSNPIKLYLVVDVPAIYSRTSMARTCLGLLKIVRNMSSSSH